MSNFYRGPHRRPISIEDHTEVMFYWRPRRDHLLQKTSFFNRTLYRGLLCQNTSQWSFSIKYQMEVVMDTFFSKSYSIRRSSNKDFFSVILYRRLFEIQFFRGRRRHAISIENHTEVLLFWVTSSRSSSTEDLIYRQKTSQRHISLEGLNKVCFFPSPNRGPFVQKT